MVLTTVRDVAAVARERQLAVKSAGLAYHAFNTLVPLVILALVAATVVDAFEPLLEGVETATGLEGTLTDDGLAEAAGNGADRLRAAALATAVLLWSAGRAFQAVNSAFTAVYDSRESQSYVESVTTVTVVTAVNTALLTATVAIGVAVVSVVGVSLSILAEDVLVAAASSVVLLGLLFVLFLPMYYLFPQTDVTVREIAPGTALAALTWTVLAVGFRWYVLTSESVALFGIAGAVLLILTWVYFGGLALLLGAVLNAVLAGRVDPDETWVPLRGVWPREN